MWLREDGTPYYVGKGSGNRAYKWHRIGKAPIGRIVFFIAKDEADAFETEVVLIWYYGRKDLGTGCLRNLTNGGESPPSNRGRKLPPRSEEYKRKQIESHLGVKFTEERRAAHNKAQSASFLDGRAGGFSGKSHSDKAKQSMKGTRGPNRRTK